MDKIRQAFEEFCKLVDKQETNPYRFFRDRGLYIDFHNIEDGQRSALFVWCGDFGTIIPPIRIGFANSLFMSEIEKYFDIKDFAIGDLVRGYQIKRIPVLKALPSKESPTVIEKGLIDGSAIPTE